ncbi:sensor histidine kinase [Streptomyces sulphureus]|uniref:sensor histidine kinase n=1 Tax=Streptomyces sulphureus TaxID=47758 RepID=UPI0003799237|nr:histidine kinase [Streptomyces sulphureus]
MTSPRRLRELWRRLPVTVRDLPLGLPFLVASLLPSLHNNGTQLGGVPDRPFDTLAVAAIALQCLPLALRRRWPLACVLLVVLGFAVDQLRGYHTFAGSGLPIAVLSAGVHLDRHRRPTFVLLALAYVPLAVALDRLGSGEGLGTFVTFFAAVALAWGIGVRLRSTRAEEAARRRRVADETRTAERTRIARELHDVVTHHVTAMVVQAEAARYLTGTPERLDQTLDAVTDTGRHAIGDLRHLLDLLNPDHRTAHRNGTGTEIGTPPAGKLRALVEQTHRAGQPVELSEEGTPAESTVGDELAYRVVQESLTNALKYAYGSRTSVRVHRGPAEITVEVGTDDARFRFPSPGGSGRGLAGLRERVDVLGGDFSAGGREGGGFVVRARIPAGGRT